MIKSEQIYRMKNQPRSYDMSRTHIMHKSVNKHVDVVLKSAPKNWKKKRAAVHAVKNNEKKESVKIRLNAKKGYVAVKKKVNAKYASDRKHISDINVDDVVCYETVHLKNRGLIHDMKSQISLMAKKSSNYIDEQLNNSQKESKPVCNSAINEQKAYAQPKSETASVQTESTLEQQIEAQLDNSASYVSPNKTENSDYHPYANNYSKHVSDAEFHSLMESLEKSLDEAFRRTGVTEQSLKKNNAYYNTDTSFTTTSYSGYSQSTPLSVDTASQKANTFPTTTSQSVESVSQNDPFTPVTSFEANENYHPLKEEVFSVDNQELFPGQPKEEAMDYTPVKLIDEPEEEYRPIMITPDDDEAEEEYRPIMMIPDDEDEEEYHPIIMMPDDDEAQSYDNSGYEYANHDLPSNNYEPAGQDTDYYDFSYDSERHSQTMLSRTGDKIKKAIGIIRGKNTTDSEDSHSVNKDVEISYSDGENSDW